MELARLRRRVDAIDRRIVALLNERARLALEIAAAKASTGRSLAKDAARESEVLQRVGDANTGPLAEKDLLELYTRLLSVTRRLQAEQGRILRRTSRASETTPDRARR